MKIRHILALPALMGLCLGAQAGTTVVHAERPSPAPSVQVERPPQLLQESDANFGATVRERRQASGHTLRCWQNGRLLYEGSGFVRQLERSADAIPVGRPGEDPVTVLDLKQGLCILSGS